MRNAFTDLDGREWIVDFRDDDVRQRLRAGLGIDLGQPLVDVGRQIISSVGVLFGVIVDATETQRNVLGVGLAEFRKSLNDERTARLAGESVVEALVMLAPLRKRASLRRFWFSLGGR